MASVADGTARIDAMSDDVIRRRAIVQGNVQGVFFRDSTRRHAESRGVRGWVRNRDDGAVEAVLEGPQDAVDQVLRFLREGPSRADVRNVQVSEEPPEGLSSFEVR
jgi:acylphosphatase